MAETWTILMTTLASRQEKFRSLLLDVLLPQAEAAGPDEVRILGLHNRAQSSLGEYRGAVVQAASGEYLSFVDDDDMVMPDFMETVLEAMHSNPGVDYIAFQHEYRPEGVLHHRPVVTGLELEGRPDDAGAMYRPVSIVNPVRSAIAKQCPFGPVSGTEDGEYVHGILRIARTQVVISRPLYQYSPSVLDSVQSMLPPQPDLPPLKVDSPVFSWLEGGPR